MSSCCWSAWSVCSLKVTFSFGCAAFHFSISGRTTLLLSLPCTYVMGPRPSRLLAASPPPAPPPPPPVVPPPPPPQADRVRASTPAVATGSKNLGVFIGWRLLAE